MSSSYEGTLKILNSSKDVTFTFTSASRTCEGTFDNSDNFYNSYNPSNEDISVQAVLKLDGEDGSYMFQGYIGGGGIDLYIVAPIGRTGSGRLTGPAVDAMDSDVHVQGGIRIEKRKN